MTVLENVMVGRHVQSKSGFFSALLNIPSTRKEEKDILEKSMEKLRLLGIEELAHEDASSLAFGQQRSVELARALNSEPELLLLDEPAAGLNIYETAELAKMITRIRDMGITILLIEHDMSLVMDISDDIVVLGSGAMIAQGLPQNIQKNEDVIRIYLGDEDA
jgi:branched-chain amino acid transport system ATP-binding protein